MKAGSLRHRITFQSQGRTRDSYGGETVVWSDEVTVWAQVHPISGSEYFKTQEVQSQVTHNIRIRYPRSFDIKPTWRIKFLAQTEVYKYFDIVSIINPEERNIYLDIMAKEAVV